MSTLVGQPVESGRRSPHLTFGGHLEQPSILDNLTDESDDASIQAPRTRVGAFRTPPWLVRVLVESSLIVFSILVALGVQEFKENREHQKLAQQALQIFQSEIEQNLKRLDDALPYHAGLQNVVAQIAEDPRRATELRSVLEGLEPAPLLNTAWQTALATGALAFMDVRTVAALSLTYSMEERFRETNRSIQPRLTLTGADPGEQSLAIQEALGYLTELVSEEQDLKGVYIEALAIVRTLRGEAPADSAVAAEDAAATPGS